MTPWKRQQIWFWLAAILIVTGASALRDKSHQTVDSNRGFMKPQKSTSVIRNRSDLPPVVNQEKLPTETILPIQRVAFEEQIKLENHPDLRELVAEQDEIVHADFSETQVGHKDRATQIVQLSFEQVDSDQADRPAVWLSGTIESIEDAPQILSR